MSSRANQKINSQHLRKERSGTSRDNLLISAVARQSWIRVFVCPASLAMRHGLGCDDRFKDWHLSRLLSPNLLVFNGYADEVPMRWTEQVINDRKSIGEYLQAYAISRQTYASLPEVAQAQPANGVTSHRTATRLWTLPRALATSVDLVKLFMTLVSRTRARVAISTDLLVTGTMTQSSHTTRR
jgi:hypothetical protein